MKCVAVEKNIVYDLKTKRFTMQSRYHEDVELMSNKNSSIRVYRCRHCKKEWRESNHSPLIIDESTLRICYPEIKPCK